MQVSGPMRQEPFDAPRGLYPLSGTAFHVHMELAPTDTVLIDRRPIVGIR